MLKFVIHLWLIGIVFSECPKYDTVPIKLEHQIGTWNIHAILRNTQKIGRVECLSIPIRGDNLGVQPVLLEGHAHGQDIDGGTVIMIDAEAEITNLQRPGVWNVKYTSDRVDYFFNGSVVYTDYLEYSIVILCNDVMLEDTDIMDVFFLSRGSAPIPDSTRINFLDWLKTEFNIDGENYVTINQDPATCEHSSH